MSIKTHKVVVCMDDQQFARLQDLASETGLNGPTILRQSLAFIDPSTRLGLLREWLFCHLYRIAHSEEEVELLNSVYRRARRAQQLHEAKQQYAAAVEAIQKSA